jgi:hypothetical protein
MNKNLVIAVLVFAVGGWYFISGRKDGDRSAKAGAMSAAGVYADEANGFSIAFPAGWKEVPASHISAENGYKFYLPRQAGSALVVIPPGPEKAAAMLIKSARGKEQLKELALQTLQAMGSLQRADLGSDSAGPAYKEDAGAGGGVHRITGHAVLGDNSLAHYCFFAGAESVFILYTVAEPGYKPGLPAELDGIAASVRRL